MIAWFERSLTKTGKVLTAWGVVLSALVGGGTVVYHLDNRYVHMDAYAAERKADLVRIDQTELAVLETNKTLVQSQIFTLERQATLTNAEAQFHQDLKNRLGDITDKIKVLQRKIEAAKP